MCFYPLLTFLTRWTSLAFPVSHPFPHPTIQQALSTIRNDKEAKAKERRSEKLAQRDAKLAKEKEKFEPMQKNGKEEKISRNGQVPSLSGQEGTKK